MLEQRYDMVKMQQAEMRAEAAANHLAMDARGSSTRHGGILSLAQHVRAMAGAVLHHERHHAGSRLIAH